jgi:hypothetical protein
VAVATLSGSIVARNREYFPTSIPHRSRENDEALFAGGVLLRFTLPPAFLLLATSYFLPHSWENLVVKAEQLEGAHFPQLRELRETATKR